MKKNRMWVYVRGNIFFARCKMIYTDWPCGRMCIVGDILDKMVADYLKEHPDSLFEVRTYLNTALAPALARANGEKPTSSDMDGKEWRAMSYHSRPDMGSNEPFSPTGGYVLWGEDPKNQEWNKIREKKMQGLK